MPYNFDVHSPMGMEAQQKGEWALGRLTTKINRDFIFFVDHDEKNRDPMYFDGYICKNNKILAMFEVRTRNAEVQIDGIVFRGIKYPTYMITKKKLDKCCDFCRTFNLPFILFIYFNHNDSFLVYRIIDRFGNFLLDFEVRETQSQYSVNGGTIIRENAFINVSDGKIIKL